MTDHKCVYPEWVQQYRTRGTTIKKKGDNYYLYKRTSKRIPGKKYPQTVDTYVGVITPNGVINAERKVVSASSCEVCEYGYSKTMQAVCPQEWKKVVGENWDKVLLVMIGKQSRLSYLKHDVQLPEEKDFSVNWNSLYSSYLRRIRNEYDVSKNELEELKDIFIVYHDKSRFLSKVSEEQQAVLDKLHMQKLEVS